MTEYGHFSDDGRQFVITERDIPRNWYNYVWNEDYNAFFSQVGYGEGMAQGVWGQRCKPVTNRAVYLISDGVYRMATAVPDGITSYDFYECRHALGCTEIVSEKCGIRSKLTFTVPEKGQLELWHLELENLNDEEKTVKAIAYASTDMDGDYKFQGYNTSEAHFSQKSQAVMLRSDTCNRKKGVMERCYAYITADKVDAYDARATAFIGTYGTITLPKAVLSGGCTNSDCIAEKACLAVESDFNIPAHGKAEVTFYAGLALSDDEINAEKERFDSPEKFFAERDRIVAKRRAECSGVSLKTPIPELDKLFEWLKYETDMSARWSRVRSNGFRDMTSDSDCLMSFAPELGLERLKYILSFQYPNGYAPRRVMNGGVQDSNFSDNAVWMTFAATTALREFGDVSVLDCEIPFNDGTKGTLYEHCRRAIDFLYHFQGAHGLIKIWGGDWNDTLERAGLEGKGESVWLSIAWYRAANEFIALARAKGCEADAKWAEELAEDMREKVDKYGWDGEYYVTAIDDDGKPIGSHNDTEARIFALPNLWACWSGIGIDGKGKKAYAAMERELDTPLGMKVSAPPFTAFRSNIGGMSCKAPGVHENGGVYLHVSAWKLAVDSLLRRPESVKKVLYSMLPFTNPEVAGRAEPYTMFNSYFPKECGYRYGTPGQSWRTASGPWLVKSLVSYVFGLKGEKDGLRLSPCLPPDWEKCSICKDFRGAHYDIEYIGGGCNVDRIEVDGEQISGTLLPFESGKSYKVKAYLS